MRRSSFYGPGVHLFNELSWPFTLRLRRSNLVRFVRYAAGKTMPTQKLLANLCADMFSPSNFNAKNALAVC
jgi:hypothetical protein